MLDMTTRKPFKVLHTPEGNPFVFVAAEHKLVVIGIFRRDGIQAVPSVAIRDGKTNLATEYTFDFSSAEDAEAAVAALNAGPEPE